METIIVKAKNSSNIFVDSDLDENNKQEIYLAIHITGGSLSTRMTREQGVRLVEALQAALAHNEQVV